MLKNTEYAATCQTLCFFTKLPSAKKYTTEHTRHNIQCCGVHPVRSKSVERMLRGHVQHTGAYPEYAPRTCLKNTQRVFKVHEEKTQSVISQAHRNLPDYSSLLKTYSGTVPVYSIYAQRILKYYLRFLRCIQKTLRM